MSTEPKDCKIQDGRRRFLKTAATTAAAGIAVTAFSRAFAQAPAAGKTGAKLDMVKPSESQAQALGYVEDAAKTDTKKFAKRATPEGKKQFCRNCQFYNGAETAEAAPCTIFGNRGVKGAGWCNSWVHKPGTKL